DRQRQRREERAPRACGPSRAAPETSDRDLARERGLCASVQAYVGAAPISRTDLIRALDRSIALNAATSDPRGMSNSRGLVLRHPTQLEIHVNIRAFPLLALCAATHVAFAATSESSDSPIKLQPITVEATKPVPAVRFDI